MFNIFEKKNVLNYIIISYKNCYNKWKYVSYHIEQTSVVKDLMPLYTPRPGARCPGDELSGGSKFRRLSGVGFQRLKIMDITHGVVYSIN